MGRYLPYYRRWGPGYWWQNTRLPYYSMCRSGDFDLMLPLFEMYAGEVFELCKYRTRHYFGHGGAYYPECIYFWGACFSETYGWTPFEERKDKLQTDRWHKWEWVSGLELAFMMLDYYEHTLDEKFLRDRALPLADEVITFFDNYYKEDSDGKLLMHPSQAVETWRECTNPMPEVAGLYAVTSRLLALPHHLTTIGQRYKWKSLTGKLPDIPTRLQDGVIMLAPAAKYANKRNSENPELYAVFPFRLFAVGKPNIDQAIAALDHRWDKGDFGWRQDDVFMAYLGLADQARKNLVGRANKKDPGSRFSAFWGPNYDWVPDQDHGSILLKAFQAMLMQTDGKKIFLMPAWPKDWDADFKLCAPYKTTVEGKIRNGKIKDLKVTPKSRLKDIITKTGRF
ncbi:MAG: glycosyl hydrolase family 95 catalytic domain-containing protein, partial [Planctomycetota bacterium]